MPSKIGRTSAHQLYRTFILAILFPSLVFARTPIRKRNARGSAPLEQRAERAYEAARSNALDLHAFLARMPKGADLHYHLFGGIYAETWITTVFARIC